MGSKENGKGKHRWFSFHRRSDSKMNLETPVEFLCPVSGSLMYDPVVVSTGQTFERISVDICREIGFVPELEDGSISDFSTVITNKAMKTTILSWCKSSSTEFPTPPDPAAVERLIRDKMKSGHEMEMEFSPETKSAPQIELSELQLLKGIPEKPPLREIHADTMSAPSRDRDYSMSSSSQESVVIASSPYTPLPFATRPACYSSSTTSLSSSSSEITETETVNGGQNQNSSSSSTISPNSPEEEEIYNKLKSADIFNQEQGLISLRKITRNRDESRVLLCTPLIISCLKSLIPSRYSLVQTNAIASAVNLSLENKNKVTIVRSGLVPLLIDVLKSGSAEAQELAAGAIFSLSLDDENKMAIGVLGALEPLLHSLRSESELTRHDSALALYHLTLVPSNRVKLVKLGAVAILLSMVRSDESTGRVLLVLCNLASSVEGRSAMLDGDAVAMLIGKLRHNEYDLESSRENCVAALFALSLGNMRFKGLAREARAAEVLRELAENGSERARDKAKKILTTLKGRELEEGDEFESDDNSESNFSIRSGYGGGRNGHFPNSSKF